MPVPIAIMPAIVTATAIPAVSALATSAAAARLAATITTTAVATPATITTATVASSTTVTAATVASSATVTAATAVAAPSGATTTAATSLFHGTRLIHFEWAPFEVLPVQGTRGLLGLLVAAHLHKAKALGPARRPIRDETNRLHSSKSGEQLLNSALLYRKRQIADVKFPSHNLF